MPRRSEPTERVLRRHECGVALIERLKRVNLFRTPNQGIAAEVASMSTKIKDDRILERYSYRISDKYVGKRLIIDLPIRCAQEHPAGPKVKRDVAPEWRGQPRVSRSVPATPSPNRESTRNNRKPQAGWERQSRLEDPPNAVGKAQLQGNLPLRTGP